MATANSAVSFQGLSTGLQTDALVNAILAQEGKSVEALQARQTRNIAKTTALNAMKSSMNSLSISLAALQDKFNARTVTSTDSNNTNVTATATGAAAGSYDLTVATVATKGRISSTMVGGVPQNLAVADPAAAIFSSGKASFAVRGTDGVLKTFELTNNSLNGLRDAINASGAGVSAAVINTGAGANPYQLVVTAKDTGTGTTGGVVTLAAIANEDATATTVDPALGITSGTIAGPFSAPSDLTGGLQSGASETAKDAVFTLNGIQLTRKTNVVTDAADGVTFTLKQGGQTGTTTLTVAQDKATAAAGMQDVITKFNALLKVYKDASTSTKDSNGTILPAALAGDASSRAIISQIRSTLTGASAGLPGTSAYSSPAGLGVYTLADGTLSLNTSTFQAAIEKDPAAAKRLFTFSGNSNNGVLAFQSGGAKTATGSVGFTINSYTAGGPVSGTFTGTANGPITLTGTNGTLVGGIGTDLEGLTVSVTAIGSGTLTLSRGAGQATRDLISKLTASGSGSLATALTAIDTQNRTLTTQIDAGQSALDRRKKVLQAQFSKMEVAIAQMKAAGGSLTTL
ncbi:MAG TPA: flagellar filament capping protein FliD [Geothrix sp.]|jgi:flagellar hook-associated protein 2